MNVVLHDFHVTTKIMFKYKTRPFVVRRKSIFFSTSRYVLVKISEWMHDTEISDVCVTRGTGEIPQGAQKENVFICECGNGKKKGNVLKELKKGLHFGTYQEPGDLEAHLLW